MKKHYETHVEDTDKLISVAGPILEYKSWYEQYRKLMEEQAQRKYGLYTPTSEGDDDDFPSIPGTIARYSALGLTNEEMSKNPVWVDKTGNGHDIQLKNFSWKGMSGVGGYEMNFNLWRNNVSSIPDISMSTTTTSVSVSVGNSTYNNNLIYIHISNWDINKNHWLKVTSTYEDGDLAFIFYNDSNTKKIGLPANGYVNILAYPEFKGSYMYISTISNKQGSFTIEQLPLYPGALVFDGVDDYGVCDNFPILTKEKGYTVVALRQWISMGEGLYGLVSNTKNWFNDGAFILEYSSNNATNKFVNRPVSFGKVNIEMDLPNNFTYQTSKSYKGIPITTGSFKGTNSLFVGRLNNIIGNCSNAAIWELVFLDHDATEEELTKIKDYFVKTYPWLFPDQAWTVTGKTNEDEDRATIANITGNGNNLVLSNFGFAEGSGYGLYAYNFNSFNLKDNVVKSTDVKKDSFRMIGTGNSSNVLILLNESDSADWKIRITGMKEGDRCLIGNANKSGEYISVNKDGTYTFQKQYAATSTNGIWYNSSQEVDVLVEQIPEYEGYLVTDGVDDIASSNTIIYEADFTFIGEWKFIQKDDTVADINSSSHLYIQNRYNRGATIMINSTFESKKNITDYMTFKAITSKGKAYDENWNEVDLLYGDGYKGPSGVNIGGQGGTEFCHMIFKNMALYMNKVFSKDDCIKAYNYLQTLKAK